MVIKMLENRIKELKNQERITIDELNELLKLFDKEMTTYYHCNFETQCADWIYMVRHKYTSRTKRIYLMNVVENACRDSFKDTREALKHLEYSLELHKEYEIMMKEFEEQMLA